MKKRIILAISALLLWVWWIRRFTAMTHGCYYIFVLIRPGIVEALLFYGIPPLVVAIHAWVFIDTVLRIKKSRK